MSKKEDLEGLRDSIIELTSFKILMLGAGETGKSTFIRQLKLIYDQRNHFDCGFTREWLMRDAVECMQQLLKAVQEKELQDDEMQAKATKILGYQVSASLRDPALAADIEALWKCEEVQEVYRVNRANPQFWILDRADYYFANIGRFQAEGFTPNDEDVVSMRVITSGIQLVQFSDAVDAPFMEKYLPSVRAKPPHALHLNWCVVDVGGQRNERRKWMSSQCMDGVMSLIWMVGLCEYNQVCYEDESKRRIIESLDLFGHWANHKLFDNIPIFLVFNKYDLFCQMIATSPLQGAFPDYISTPGMEPAESAFKYIKEMFLRKLKPDKQVSVQVCTATERSSVEAMLQDMKEMITTHKRQEITEAIAATKTVRKQERRLSNVISFGSLRRNSSSSRNSSSGQNATRSSGGDRRSSISNMFSRRASSTDPDMGAGNV